MFGAVDVGGTKTLVAVFDASGKLLEKIRFETPPLYKDFRIELAKTVDKLSTKDFVMTTVAMPGRIDRPHGIGITFGNLPWKKVSIRDHSEKIFKSPVLIENDANLAGLYEAKLLLKKYKRILYLTVSTGIGGGICVNGRIDPNLEDMEPGSILFDHDGKMQSWESFASGKAIYKHFGMRASDITNPEDWDLISKNLAVGVIELIATLTPEIIVFGGGVGAHFEKFHSRLEKDLKEYASELMVIPPLMMAIKPEDAVLYGCYYLSKDKYESVNN